jgi:hypothetical protein
MISNTIIILDTVLSIFTVIDVYVQIIGITIRRPLQFQSSLLRLADPSAFDILFNFFVRAVVFSL